MSEESYFAAVSACSDFADEDFETLVLGNLPARLQAELESHVLACPLCQDREASAIEYVATMRSALLALAERQRGKSQAAAGAPESERRASPRLPCYRAVVIQHEPRPGLWRQVKARLRDISEGGFGLVAKEELSVDTPVAITDGRGLWRAVVRRSSEVDGHYFIGLQLAAGIECRA